jgi:predicted nucleic acid-binding protein
VAYLDSSAIVKLIIAEEESSGLRGWLGSQARVATCAIARTEVRRAVRHVGPDALALAHQALAELDIIAVDDRLLDTAAVLDPAILRSLDAIHLAAALSLGDDLAAVVCYDARMLDGARVLGLPTARPT